MNNPKWHSDGARRCFPPSPSPPSRTVTQLDFLSFSLPCCIFDEDRKKEGGGGIKETLHTLGQSVWFL